jgi:hypothetical protein
MAVLRDLRGCASLTTGQNRRKEATCWQLKKESFDMARYLTSFDDGSMDHIPEAELPAVDEAAHNVVRERKLQEFGFLAVASFVSRRPLLRRMEPFRKDRCLRLRRFLVDFPSSRCRRGMKH